jgi:hypothetical protein
MSTAKQKPKLDITAEVMEITPAMARELLAMNNGNRTLRRGTVEKYKADMLAGAWKLNGEAIIRNGDRTLNGQHRLTACVEADVPFTTLVVSGVDEEAMGTMDLGASRNAADVMRWKGYKDVNRLASVTRSLWMWDHSGLLNYIFPSVNQVVAYLEEHPEVASAADFARRVAQCPARMRMSVGGPIYYKALTNDAGDAAHEFFDRIIDGEHMSGGDPVYALRRVLIQNASRTHGKMSSVHQFAITVKAWNAWVRGESLEFIKWRRRGSAGGVESFPVMVNLDGDPISSPQS